jgi:hypothetical protein
MAESNKSAVRSDPPPEDLKRERDTFIQQFFRRGAQISEELLSDIDRLRRQVSELEGENAQMRAQLASDTAIRDLLRKIEELEEEKRRLVQASMRPPEPKSEFEGRFADLENELANLGTVHVANIQLHSSTSVRRAFRSLRELLAQFLGAQQFGLYWVSDDYRTSDDPTSTTLVPVAVEGLTTKEAREFSLEDLPAAASFKRGEIWFDQRVDTSTGSPRRPAALVPMSMFNQRLGAIVIFKTLPQKTSFEQADYELFKLLSTQAAPAIVHAHLFAEAGKRAPSVQAFIDQED